MEFAFNALLGHVDSRQFEQYMYAILVPCY